MSNPVKWRGRGRTETPNSRQKRNKLYLDAHPSCCRCPAASEEAHHCLPHGNPHRNDWRHMKPLCIPCHTAEHRPAQRVTVALTITVES